MNVIQNIGKSIADSFSKSVEAYIAVALVGDSCFRILDKAKKTNKIKFVVGVNLPTPVEVLKELKNRYSSDAKIYRCEFFHPKVYLFRMKDGSLVAYVGSANFTDGGMNTNVELSVAITNQDTCKSILGWFSKVFEEAEPITDNFLANYKEYTAKWTKKRKEQENDFILITKELDICQMKRYEDIKLGYEKWIRLKYPTITKDSFNSYISGLNSINMKTNFIESLVYAKTNSEVEAVFEKTKNKILGLGFAKSTIDNWKSYLKRFKSYWLEKEIV